MKHSNAFSIWRIRPTFGPFWILFWSFLPSNLWKESPNHTNLLPHELLGCRGKIIYENEKISSIFLENGKPLNINFWGHFWHLFFTLDSPPDDNIIQKSDGISLDHELHVDSTYLIAFVLTYWENQKTDRFLTLVKLYFCNPFHNFG